MKDPKSIQAAIHQCKDVARIANEQGDTAIAKSASTVAAALSWVIEDGSEAAAKFQSLIEDLVVIDLLEEATTAAIATKVGI